MQIGGWPTAKVEDENVRRKPGVPSLPDQRTQRRLICVGMRPMNAQTAKDQFTYTLGNASYVDYLYDEPPVTVVKTPQPSIRQWLSRAVSAVVEWRRRQAVLQEMQMLTDRELADIGLTRADLPRVFDPAFAVSHARGRDYIGY